ncbi:hypothetical protein K0M31_018283, partial [Melipona bicolor]
DSSKSNDNLGNVRRFSRRGKAVKLSLVYTRPVSATSLSGEVEEEHTGRETLRLPESRAFSRLLVWKEVTLYEANVESVKMFHVAGATLAFSCAAHIFGNTPNTLVWKCPFILSLYYTECPVYCGQMIEND